MLLRVVCKLLLCEQNNDEIMSPRCLSKFWCITSKSQIILHREEDNSAVKIPIKCSVTNATSAPLLFMC